MNSKLLAAVYEFSGYRVFPGEKPYLQPDFLLRGYNSLLFIWQESFRNILKETYPVFRQAGEASSVPF